MKSCIVRSDVISRWHVNLKVKHGWHATYSRISSPTCKVSAGVAPPRAHAVEENGYRRLFYAFCFAYEHRGETFGYRKVLEDTRCMNFEYTAVSYGATAHLSACSCRSAEHRYLSPATRLYRKHTKLEGASDCVRRECAKIRTEYFCVLSVNWFAWCDECM